jgi:lipopolysaccharide transport system ATP-binding protein
MNIPIKVVGLRKSFRRKHMLHPGTLKEAIVGRLQRSESNEEFLALDQVDLEVHPGEIVGVIGRNGAGKSTLLRLVGGVGVPDAGHILVQGKVGALLELGAGFHPELTGRENVFVNGVISGLTRAEVADRFDDIVAFSELEDSIDNPLRTYSSGMQLRLAFSISVHTSPDILLIDEVLAVGDLAFQQKCLERIEHFRRNGCAILIVSHDIEQVKKVCDRGIWMRDGKIAAIGEPQSVADQYERAMLLETERRRATEVPVRHTRSGYELRIDENRKGSMEMEIMDVQLQDSRGEQVTDLTKGDTLVVLISCTSRQTIRSPILSLTISDENGVALLDTNTEQLEMPDIEQGAVAKVDLGPIDLPGGDYFVDVGAYARDWGHVYDYHWHVYPLVVVAEVKPGGGAQLLPRWELLPAPPGPDA